MKQYTAIRKGLPDDVILFYRLGDFYELFLEDAQITAPIIGARNLEQLEGSLAAVDIEMTADWYEQISALSYTPPPANDRLEEAK